MTDAAVEETEGQVLLDASNLNLIDTVYSANCGGHTENNESVWNSFSDPNLRGVKDQPSSWTSYLSSPSRVKDIERWLTEDIGAYCNNSKTRGYFRWRVSFNPSKINSMVNKHYSLGQVLEIIPLERGVSGRIERLRIVGTRRTVEVEKELPIRKLFGGLKSALFLIKSHRDKKGKPRTFEFIGGGYGHGVGMCQMGAIGRAQKGQDYKQILKHYYARSEVKGSIDGN